jgi:ElaB/YqjD/DUF883 family membrane-anchored ribosome-binding protein
MNKQHIKESVDETEPANRVGNGTHRISDAAHRAYESAQQATRRAREGAHVAMERSEDYVRQNPVPVVLGAIVVGFALGFALGRREPLTARERFLEEPLGHARDVFFSVLAPVAQRLRDQYGELRSAAEDAAEKVHDFDASARLDPAVRQARRLGRRLKFW